MSISISISTPDLAKQSTSVNSEYKEIGVQTVVKVFPFVLEPTISHAQVTSDKKFCTVLSLEASQNSKQFFRLLQYCPFHDIQENNIRVLDLPRKTKLQWLRQERFPEDALKKLSLADDDGVADFCTDMLIRMHSDKRPNFTEAETQTELMATGAPDTIHYLSPASTVARTECEGDLDYQQFYISPLVRDHVDYQPGLGSITSSSTSIPCSESNLQRTLAIVKPDALDYKDVVLRAMNEAGLKIVNQRTVHLTPEQVSEIYEKYYGTPAFPHMVVSMSISPILVLSLQGCDAVEKWKNMVGPIGTLREEWFFPFSVRTRFGLLGDIPQGLHASEGMNEARSENRYFYPRDIQEPLPSSTDKVKDYVTVFLRPTLLQGLAEIVRTKPIDPVLSLAEWLLLHNPFQPHFPDIIALAPT